MPVLTLQVEGLNGKFYGVSRGDEIETLEAASNLAELGYCVRVRTESGKLLMFRYPNGEHE